MRHLMALGVMLLLGGAAGAEGIVLHYSFNDEIAPSAGTGEGPRFVPSPRGRAIALDSDRSVTLPAPDASALRDGFTLRMWMRIDGELVTRRTPLVSWPGVLDLQIVGRGDRPRRSIEATLHTQEGEFSSASRFAAPVGKWMLLSVAYHPEFDAEGHMSSGAYRPEVATTGLLVVTLGGVHDEPFGRSWFGAEAFGELAAGEEYIAVGSSQFEGAVDDIAILNRPEPVADTARLWMAEAPGPLAEPEADAAAPEDAWTAPGAITHLRIVPTLESIGVYSLHASPPPAGSAVRVYYRESGTNAWRRGLDLVHDSVAGVSRGSVLNLKPGTEYEVRSAVEAVDESAVHSRLAAAARTWSEQVPVGETRYLPELTEEPLFIRDQGAPDAWIVYRPRPGAEARIEAGEQAAQAVLFEDAAYVAIENVAIRGGARHAVNVVNSRDVRILRCDIARWGDPGTWHLYEDGQGRYVDAQGRRINHHAGVYLGPDSRRVLVDGNFIHSPRGTANSWAFGHPAGPQAAINAWTGGANVIRNNDMVGSEGHWWNDAIEGAGNGFVFGGPYRDTDISGNVILFANDDGIETDGGQINVRVWNNRIEHAFCGLSTAPNLRGPSYAFRNLMVHLGDERGASGASFKMGTGIFPIFGVTFLHHNTINQPPGRALNSTNTSGALMRRVGERWGQLRGSAPIISRNNIFGFGSLRYPEFPGLVRHGDFARDMIADGAFAGPHPPEDVLAPPAKFLDEARGDFRLADDSPARDAGVPVSNVSDSFHGPAPDLGAIESAPGAGAFFPARPSGMSAEPPRASFEGVVGQPSAEVEFSLTLPTSAGRTWRAHPNAPWLRCEPSQGETSDQPIPVRVSVDAEDLRRHRGAITFRTDEGHNLTVTVEATLRAAEPVALVLEAEEAARHGGMETVQDPNASGGAYVFSNEETVLRFEPDNPPQGQLVFEFEVDNEGDYYLIGRVRSPGPDTGIHDSFFYALNDDEPRIWDTRPSRPDVWEWRMMRPGRGEVETVSLERGRHRLTLWSREALTAIDVVAITDNPYKEAPPGWVEP